MNGSSLAEGVRTTDSPSLGSSVTADDFKAAFRYHPGGVALITAVADGAHVALTASSVASVSAEPPLFMFSVSALSSSATVIAAAETVVVHLVDPERIELAKLGATSGVDRFAEQDRWSELPTGERVFGEAPVWIRAQVIERIDAGGSKVLIAHALESGHRADAFGQREQVEGLVYANRGWHRIGEHSRIA